MILSAQSRTDAHPTFVLSFFTDDRNYGSNGEKGHKTMNKTQKQFI